MILTKQLKYQYKLEYINLYATDCVDYFDSLIMIWI